MKLRSHLIKLVTAAVVPLFIFAVVMVVLFGREQRRAVEEGLADTARALSLAIDRELLASIRTLEALATSEHLDSGELRKFYEQAKRVRAAHGEWETILLVDPSGQQLINLRQPFESPLPRSGALYLIKQVSETGRPAVSNLFWGHIAQRHLFGVDVPVIRDGRVRYVLTASTSPVSLVKLLEKQKIPRDRFATLIDRNKVIIARTRDFEQFLGKPAAPLFAAKTSEEQEGFRRGVTHDGWDVYAAFRKSELSGWTVGLAVPVAVAEGPIRRSLMMVVVGGFALLVGAVLLATVFGRRIAKAVTALSGSAAALGRGETPHSVASAITEVNQVAQAIEDAAVSRKHAEERLQVLHEINLAMTSTLDLHVILNILAEKICILFPQSRGTIRLLNKENGSLEPVASWNFNLEEWKTLTFERGGVSTAVCEAKAPLTIPDLLTDHRTKHRDFAAKHGLVSFLGIPLMVDDNTLGVLNFYTTERREFHKEEIAFFATVASQAAMAIHNAQLYETLKRQAIALETAREQAVKAKEDLATAFEEKTRLQEELLDAIAQEQERTGRDLHDGVGQQLTGIAFLAKGLEEKLSRKSIPEGADAGKIAVLVAQAVSQTRNLARGLSPVPVGGNSLMSALEELAASASSLFGVACRFRCDPPVLLQDNAVATHLYRIAQEAVDNAVKHGQPSQVLISLAQAGGTITLAMADDGRGLQGEPQNVEGMGLRIMRYRAEVIGAMLDIQSRPQGGVVVTCSISNP